MRRPGKRFSTRCEGDITCGHVVAARPGDDGGKINLSGKYSDMRASRELLDCLERRGETVEAALIRQRVELIAARADVPVPVSCFRAWGGGRD